MAGLKIGLVKRFRAVDAWEAWLCRNHASAKEVWLRIAKKGSRTPSVSRDDAVEVALCYGWIDGQAASLDEASWLQRFSPRTRHSNWSSANRALARRLMASGKMKPAGLAQVTAAKRDGRWAAAQARHRAKIESPG